MRVAEGTIPGADSARVILARARGHAAAGGRQRVDLDWLAKLDRLTRSPTAPAGRVANIELTLKVNAWWRSRRGAWPRQRVILRLPSGILANYRPEHGFIVNPVATTGRWQHLNDDVPAAGLARALRPLAVVYHYGDETWLGYEYYDVNGSPREVLPGVSAMAQSRLASTFAAAFRQTGYIGYARTASRILGAFRVPVADHGVVAMLESPDHAVSGEWFPERVYPGKNPWLGAALNGFMVSILELTTARTHLSAALDERNPPPATRAEVRKDIARIDDLAQTAIVSLRRFLPLHDTGHWSIYGMRTGGRPWGTALADLNYHCYHIRLLSRLDLRYPGEGFEDYARRWQGYVDAAGRTCPTRG